MLREINGTTVADGRLSRAASRALAADGSTACGCWIYSGVYPAAGQQSRARARPRAARTATAGDTRGRPIAASSTTARPRDPTAGRGASARSSSGGTTQRREWTGHDTPDFTQRQAAIDYAPARTSGGGDAALRGDAPFIMHADGVGLALGANGLKDGPLPAHYEPLESPVRQRALRAADESGRRSTRRVPTTRMRVAGDPRFPHVLTTYRLTEHHTAGGMSRTLSHLAELQPELFCEISPELAARNRRRQRRRVAIVTRARRASRRARWSRRACARSTIDGRTMHQVGAALAFRRHAAW